jgi:enediyne biosynthesis protein E4
MRHRHKPDTRSPIQGQRKEAWWRSAWTIRLALGAVVVLGVSIAGISVLRPKSRVDPLELRKSVTTAISELEQGRINEAAQRLDAVLEVEPQNSQALLFRGQAAWLAKRTDEARSFWRRIDDTHSVDLAMARFLEGAAAMESQRAWQAETLWLESLVHNSRLTKARERLVHLYVVQLRTEDLREQLRAIRRARPWTAVEHAIYRLASNVIEDPAKAIPQLQGFVRADPSDISSWVALLRYLLAAHRPAEVISNFTDAPPSVRLDSRAKLAYIAALLDESSTNAAQALAELWPNADKVRDIDWWHAFGLQRYAQEDWSNAAAALEYVSHSRPEASDVRYKWGQSLSRSGQTDRAKPILELAHQWEQISVTAQRLLYGDLTKTDLAFPIVLETAQQLTTLHQFEEATWWYELALQWKPGTTAAIEGWQFAHAQLASARTESRLTAIPPLPKVSLVTPNVPSLSPNRPARPESPNTSPAESPAPTIEFVDEAAQRGLHFVYDTGRSPLSLLLESIGGGVAVFDFDHDDQLDFFLPQGRPVGVDFGLRRPLDALFRQQYGQFFDVAALAGVASDQYGQGVAAGDWNNDGFVDLVVGNYGTLEWYANQGDGTFRQQEVDRARPSPRWTASLGWGDLDRDGDLDLFVVNYLQDAERVCRDPNQKPRTCSPENYASEPDQLYENLGDGSFREVSNQWGIDDQDGKGLGVMIADFDDDGWPDIYVSNDGTPNHLYRNRATTNNSLRFEEIGLVSGTALSGRGVAQAGMGIACADFDGDQRLDLYVTNFFDDVNTLYHNDGGNLFSDVTEAVALAEPTRKLLGFGTQAADFNADGWTDLFVANGHIGDFRDQGIPWKMPAQLFVNQSGQSFAEQVDDDDAWRIPALGRGVARCDWNRDGRVDLFVVYQDRPASLLTNHSSGGNTVSLELIGIKSNRDAIGARLEIRTDDHRWRSEICGGDGFLATNDRSITVGIGKATEVDVEVFWPSGGRSTHLRIPAGVRVHLEEQEN